MTHKDDTEVVERMSIEELVARAELVSRLPSPSTRRSIRESAGATQRDIAEAIGVSKQAIERWERGEAKPRGYHAAAYVSLLEDLERAAVAESVRK